MLDDYVEAFKLHVAEPTLEPYVFEWIENSLETLILLEKQEDLVFSVKRLFSNQFSRKKKTDLTSIGKAA